MYSKTDSPAVEHLLSRLRESLSAASGTRRWVVALSGGLDSSLLLELMARLRDIQPLSAIHIDHQLQAGSADWAEHCRRHCERLDIPLQRVRVQPASSSEAAARQARYAAFESLLQSGDCLLLAQHADDQAETLLLRLLRGAGVAGLAAMPRSRALGQGRLLRPLLNISRAELESVASTLALLPVEDPSNAQDRYDRNWLRHHVMPLLKQRWPRVLERCGDSAVLMADARQLLEERARDDRSCLVSGENRLDLAGLQQLSAARQRNLLHDWLWRETGHRLEQRRILSLQQRLADTAVPEGMQERIANHQLRCYRGGAYLLPLQLPAVPDAQIVQVGQEVDLGPGLGFLRWRPAKRGLAAGVELQLLFRQGGERLRPLGRGGAVSLKQVLQESGMPPWQRSYQPLLVQQGEILALPGICLCEAVGDHAGLIPEWDAFGLS